MGSYHLSRRADSDLLDTFIFGTEQFGTSQARIYQHELANSFQLLADNPGLGRKAEIVGKGVRRHESGRHVILYEESFDGVLILALVHQSSIRRLKL